MRHWNWHEYYAPALSRALEGACSVKQFMRPRRYLVGIVLWFCALSVGSLEVRAQVGKVEAANVTIGLSVNDSTFLPIYLAEAAGYYKDEGLNVRVLAFRGGSDLTRALVAGSVRQEICSMICADIGSAFREAPSSGETKITWCCLLSPNMSSRTRTSVPPC